MDGIAILIPIFGIVGGIGSVVYLMYAILAGFRSRQQTMLTREFSNKLLDRVASAHELTALMESEGGKRLLTSVSGGAGNAHSRILSALQSGLVLAVVGVGFFLYAFLSPTIPLEGFEIMTMLGTIALSLGVGLLLAAAGSVVMSRRLGLMNGQNDSRPSDRVHTA